MDDWNDGKMRREAEVLRDITRGVLAVIFIVALIGFSIWILRPFLGAVVWAAMIVVATWPLMISVQAWLWGKRALAVAVMTILLLGVLVVPLTLAIGTIVSNVDEIAAWAKSLAAFKAPSPPEWVVSLPLVGTKAAELWEGVAAVGIQEATTRVEPYAGIVLAWFVDQLGNIGDLLVEFLLAVIVAAAMYANGELAGTAPRALRTASGRATRGKRGSPRRPDGPRCRPGRCGDRAGASSFWRSRPGDCRSALRRHSYRSDVAFVHRPDRSYSRARICGGMALLDR